MRSGLAIFAVSVLVLGCGSSAAPSGPAVPSRPATGSPIVTGAPPSPPSGASPSLVVVPGACGDEPVAWVTNRDVVQVPDLPEPAARVPFRDPTFGTCVVRVTDRTVDVEPGDDSGGLKNEYSRVQAFNADGSRILVRGLAGTWYLYDAVTREPIVRLPIDAIDPRWDAADPGRLTYSDGTRLMAYTIGGEAALVHEFAADFPGQDLAAVWMRYEGSPSRDTRSWGLMAEDQDYLASAILVYDGQADRVIASRDLRDLPAETREIDSVTISPLGTFVLAPFDAYCLPGTLGTDAKPCGLMVYDRELREGRGLLRIVGHSDIALDAAGREVLVYQDVDNDTISMLDLSTGQVTVLATIDFSHTPIGLHISGRSLDVPGWAIVATVDGDPASYTWMDDQVFVLELRADGRVVRLAHTHSLVDPEMEQDYWAEPQATTNLDLTRILFTSNWGRSGSEGVDMYEIDLPSGWPATLP